MEKYKAGYIVSRLFALVGWLFLAPFILAAIFLFLGKNVQELMMVGFLGGVVIYFVLAFFLFAVWGMLFIGLSQLARAIFDASNSVARMVELLERK
ncbi:MAG: hypothetical protein ACE5HS_06085 [bacterium]